MFTILLIMGLGILLGYTVLARLEHRRLLAAVAAVGKVQAAGTVVLLFAMGVWLGENPMFWDNLREIGGAGALLAALAMAGSTAVVHVIARVFFREVGK